MAPPRSVRRTRDLRGRQNFLPKPRERNDRRPRSTRRREIRATFRSSNKPARCELRPRNSFPGAERCRAFPKSETPLRAKGFSWNAGLNRESCIAAVASRRYSRARRKVSPGPASKFLRRRAEAKARKMILVAATGRRIFLRIGKDSDARDAKS